MTHRVTLKPSGHSYEVDEGKTVLQAGLDAGYMLPYSCRAGVCRTCRGTIVEGSVDYGAVHATYLPDTDKAKGYALLCQAKPLSDLTVEVREVHGVRPRIIPCRVERLEKPAPDVAILGLGLPREAGSLPARRGAVLAARQVHPGAVRREVGRPHGLRPPRGDAGFPRHVGRAGLCLRRADRDRVGAARFQRAVPPAGRRVLCGFVPDRGRQGLNAIGGAMSKTREVIQDGIADAKTESSIVKPFVMSHGTMECYSLKESRRFYEEFLGLECVRHAKPAMVVRCGLKFHIVAVEVGAAVHPQNVLNHWGMDVGSKEAAERAHANALKYKDKYNIRQVLPVVMQHGVYSFYMADLDHNWWEIQHYPGFQNEDLFDFGDRFSMDDGAELGELKELNIKTTA